jgi:UDP-glucuronate 4-epimerase
LKILVTGAAGFIGYHTSTALLARGDTVVGLDNLNDYYDPAIKEARLERLRAKPGFSFVRANLEDRAAIADLFAARRFDRVVHLGAQAGVRYAMENPHAYIDANVQGFMNILEGCRQSKTAHCVFASSSSVYGANTNMPFSVHANVDHPLSLYAATKKANELMAHTYAHLYQVPMTGLRFFTVYGPWGRPDMSMFIFTRKLLAGEPIDVFNHGRHRRDFTYIDDIVEGVVRTMDQIAAPNPAWAGGTPDPATSKDPYRLYNIGNNNPVELMHFIACIENATGCKAKMNFLPLQLGDVPETYADVDALIEAVGFQPKTPIETGVERFVAWYRDYYRV